MSEHPILMKPELVRATIAGTKTVTRRLGKRWAKVVPVDVLWVRETFYLRFDGLDDEKFDGYVADKEKTLGPCQATAFEAVTGGYRRKVPSIHMPKWACRLWLEVVSVRRERLQDIAPSDAVREGVGRHQIADSDNLDVGLFLAAWNAINPRNPWASNPTVYRIEFKVRERR